MAEKDVTIITGAALGIGFAIARALLADGWKLGLADRDAALLDTAGANLSQDHPDAVHCYGRRR